MRISTISLDPAVAASLVAGGLPAGRLASSPVARLTRSGAAASVLGHAAIVLLLGMMVQARLAAPRDAAVPVQMVFAPPASVTAAGSQPQAAPAPLPAVRPAPALAAPPRPPAAVRRPPATSGVRRAARHAPVQAAPRPEALPPAPTPAPAPSPIATPALPDPASLARFTGEVQRAVQAAAIYPPVARRMNVQGRAQIRFQFCGGSVTGAAVAVGSRSAMLDRAALAAVRDAAYPQAPEAFGKQRLTLAVWVDFQMQPDG